MEVILICGEGIEEDRVLLLLLLCVCLDVCVCVSVCMHVHMSHDFPNWAK